MSPLDLLGLGLVGIRTRRARAALSVLGIAIGIATMVVVTGIPASSQAALDRELAALGADMLQIVPTQSQDDTTVLPAESVAMVRRIAPVTAVSATAGTAALVRRSDRTDPRDGSGLTVRATRPDLLGVLDARVRAGHWLTPVEQGFPAVVLGAVAASRLGFDELPRTGPPPQVIIGRRWFAVTGILDPIPLAPDVDRSVLVGWATATEHLGFKGNPTTIYVRAEESAVEAVRGVLPATVDPAHPENVSVTRPSEALAAKRATEATFSVLLLGLAAVALLVGGVGVANTMVVSVLERRSEIGLRRALGSSRGQIRAQFLTEAAVLAALGGLTGTVLGVLLTAGYAAAHGWPFVVPLPALLTGLAGSTLVGIVAGVYPAVSASRLTPTEALASS
ncbi:ABC transporter permease [Actinoplanes philippinensis]|uniref:Putative ABC transport system permease protein n=1 Tax=Actinoplanes philippinensis TaxID=35752 RepID=A0A1I2ENT9_9ACTN|nr:ABC transporter permease [Actinoplanes philippinensis]GIE82558.1 ABC transporter permease [Actinoplanes philippinensis]SFE94098.1 putative ABC transport system permease protein [Actinoplanes philippinensis]